MRAASERLMGVYEGIVHDVTDFQSTGTIRVRLPWLRVEDEQQTIVEARLATMMSGADRGTFFVPHVDDEVLVSFLAGHPNRPVVVGSLWNGEDRPPEQTSPRGTPAAQQNPVQSVKTRHGHVLRFHEGGDQHVELRTRAGHSLRLDETADTVRVSHPAGSFIQMDQQGKVTIKATDAIEVVAPREVLVRTLKLKVVAPMAEFTGVVKCVQLKTLFVNSKAYTQGVGNVW